MISLIGFDSKNPYESLAVIVGDSPQDLINQIKSIRTPIKIVSIIPYGGKQVAYIMGDHRLNQAKKIKKEK